jgi:MFS family permease
VPRCRSRPGRDPGLGRGRAAPSRGGEAPAVWRAHVAAAGAAVTDVGPAAAAMLLRCARGLGIHAVIGGLFLADIADRRPRRSVMITCDVVRAVLVAVMALPGMPLGVLVALLFAATMFTPPDAAARSAITPDILTGERYALGVAVTQTTFYTAQIAGAVGGGVAVVFIGVRFSLALDAVTFVLSALLIGAGIRSRPAAARPEPGQQSPLARMRDGFRLVFTDPALRTITLLAWLVVFYTIPEGVAAPYAARLGAGPVATGLVLASAVVGTTVFMPLFTRFVRPRQRDSLMGPLAVLTCGTLVLTIFRPGLTASLVIFSASAAFGVYQLAANTALSSGCRRSGVRRPSGLPAWA